jgi:hypothetical protein
MLRSIALPKSVSNAPNPARERYRDAADELERQSKNRALTADELADWGALLLRLGDVDRALEILRSAQRIHPEHFKLTANLGAAWQLSGELGQAANTLQQAVRLAPETLRPAEELHLKLVRARQGQDRKSQALDDLFGVRYVGDDGHFEPGRQIQSESKKLPANAVGLVQQLALWLPADGRLLWQLAELANASGDVRAAASIMDGCVTEFALADSELRRHRQVLRGVVEEVTRLTRADLQSSHDRHASSFKARSKRPLRSRLDLTALPEPKPNAVNALPWSVLDETVLEAKRKPAFARYVQDVGGLQVRLSGYMQPLDDDPECGQFLIVEHPIGCWFCEMPEVTGMVMVDLPPGRTMTHTRNLIKVVGKLVLNSTDPEDFLYRLTDAVVTLPD